MRKQLKLFFSSILIVWIMTTLFMSVNVEAAIRLTDWSYAKFPIKLSDFEGYTSPFGKRGNGFHSGIDIAVNTGKPVINWWNGVVKDVVTIDSGGCGLEVFVVSGRWDHRYCHLSKVLVKKGQKVSAGETLGLAGSTGRSTGPHLHFEVRFNQQLIDPARVFKAMRKADEASANLSSAIFSYENHKDFGH